MSKERRIAWFLSKQGEEQMEAAEEANQVEAFLDGVGKSMALGG